MINICKRFGETHALRNVTFELSKGEIHALVGENGAGKSTLMKVLSGAHKPDSGKIVLDGKEAKVSDTSVAKKLGIAMIYQELTLIPKMSIMENVFLGRFPKRFLGFVEWNTLERETKKSLDAVGLFVDPKTKAEKLSYAERIKVEIARALSTDAKVFVFDEPTSTLTLPEVESLFELLRSLQEKGASIIFISHRIDEIFQVCDRATVLRDGEKVGTVDIKETSKEQLVHMMVGERGKESTLEMPTPTSEVVLSVRELSKQGAYQGVSFDLHKGEVLGIAGLAGSNTMDVADSLFGLIRPDHADIHLDGKHVDVKGPAEAIKEGFALLPQDRTNGLVNPMSVADNICLPIMRKFKERLFVSSRKQSEVTNRWIKSLRIATPSVKTSVRNLSGGNQQKVLLAKWLECNPKVLILENPTRGVDVGTKMEIHELIVKLAEKMGILLISSEIPEILKLSTRTLVMRKGRIVGDFSRDEATLHKVMICITGADQA